MKNSHTMGRGNLQCNEWRLISRDMGDEELTNYGKGEFAMQ
jgi:hypothetical protein